MVVWMYVPRKTSHMAKLHSINIHESTLRLKNKFRIVLDGRISSSSIWWVLLSDVIRVKRLVAKIANGPTHRLFASIWLLLLLGKIECVGIFCHILALY